MSAKSARRSRWPRVVVATAALLCLGPGLLGSAPAFAEEGLLLWQIGTADGSSGEFRDEYGEYADASKRVVYRVADATAASWRAFHPGPASGFAGGREHVYAIEFDLTEPPAGVYRLELSILHQTPRLSYVRVDVNGQRGSFYFDPKLDYRGGDQLGITVPHTSSSTRRIDLPAELFRPGRNRIELTALDDPPDKENVWAWTPGHAGFFYDALALRHLPRAAFDPGRVTAELAPTIFYRAGESGASMQVVEGRIAFGTAPRRWKAEVSVAGHARTLEFDTGDAFGERRFEIEVPAWDGEAGATLKILAGDTTLADARTELLPGRQWTLYVVPLVHLDIGFTASAAEVEELQSEALDDALALAARDPAYRYVLDGFWVVERYLAGRSEAKREALLEAMRRGQIVSPPEIANLHTGSASLEELIRSFYAGHGFARENGVPLDAPHIVDVPAYSGAYASVLAAAGYEHFLAAPNSWRAPLLFHGRWHERSPFYWQGPDGSRVLAWFSRGYNQMQMLLGTPPRPTAARSALPIFLQTFSRESHVADAAIIFGTQSENARIDPAQVDFVRAWSKEWAWPRIEFATVDDALSEIDAQWDGGFHANVGPGGIEVVAGDFGPYWEDGLGADAALTALHRANQYRITAAETLSTAVSLLDASRAPDRERLGGAWRKHILGSEHTFTSMMATADPDLALVARQTEAKRALEREADAAIRASLERSFAQLAASIAPARRSFAVFNATGAPRTGLVEVDVPLGAVVMDPIAKAQVVAMRVARRESALPALGGGHERVRFIARDVPPLGYRMFTVEHGQRGPAGSEPTALPLTKRKFETRHYRLELTADARGVARLFDKELGVELLDRESGYRLGSPVYVTGGDDYPANSLYRYGEALAAPTLELHAARDGGLVSARQTPYGKELVLESDLTGIGRVRTTIVLFEAEKKIEIRYAFDKPAVRHREALYFPFPIRRSKAPAQAGRFAYGSQLGWVDPARDTLAGGSREWFVVAHWAAVRTDRATVSVTPLDAPLVTFGDVVRGRWPERFEPAGPELFSWALNNYWPMNFPGEQSGPLELRYVIRSYAKFEPAALTRHALAELSPLAVAEMAPRPRLRDHLPHDAASLLALDAPDLAVVTWKPAEDGRGSILRLVETSGRAGTATIGSAAVRFQKAWRTNALEDDERELATTRAGDGHRVELAYRGFEIITLRLE